MNLPGDHEARNEHFGAHGDIVGIMIPKTETNTSTTDGLLPRARWRVRRPAPAELEAAHPNPIVRNVLAHRGITEIAAARAFLEPRSGDVDPFRLAGMHAAVDRIRAAIREREPIVVFGDYDADGVTGAALLTQTLRALGADADAHIPHRERDGYGLSIQHWKRSRHVVPSSSSPWTVACEPSKRSPTPTRWA